MYAMVFVGMQESNGMDAPTRNIAVVPKWGCACPQRPRTGASITTATVIGIDLAKNVLQLHGVNEHGRVVLRRQIKREQMASFFANIPRDLRRNFVTNQAVSLASILSESSQARRTVAGC